jgi:hypothetical protein
MLDFIDQFKEMTDEEIEDWVNKNAQLGSRASDIAAAELTRRAVKDTRISVSELSSLIKEFKLSSEKISNKIVTLTWIMVILSVILAVLTAIMAFK